MKIAFALPCSGRFPIGGFRVVYEYANRLVHHGHHVTLLHATNMNFSQSSAAGKIASSLRLVRNQLTGSYLPKTWFDLDAQVVTRCSMSLAIDRQEQYDAVIATAWQTAAFVAKLQNCKRFYFIQHFEDWSGDAAVVLATWKLPLIKIAISTWLKNMVEATGELCLLVPNAIDGDFFTPATSVEARDPHSVLLQLHSKDWKGSRDALAAIEVLRRKGLKFNLNLFGLPNASDFQLVEPYTYFKNPSQQDLRKLYSENAIFVAASWSEGWGLTPHEACACGAAVAATDIGGHREFLTQNFSALLSPPKNPAALAEKIETLLKDQGVRMAIANAGLSSAHSFTWQKALAAFESILVDAEPQETVVFCTGSR